MVCSILLPLDSDMLLLVTDLSSYSLMDLQLGLVASSSLMLLPKLIPSLALIPSRSCSSGEKDLVNFPRKIRPSDKPPVRMGILPDEWF